jgi:hypothetical protein
MYSDTSIVHVRFAQGEMLPVAGEVCEAQRLVRWRYRVLEILGSPACQRGYVIVKMQVERWIIEEYTAEGEKK